MLAQWPVSTVSAQNPFVSAPTLPTPASRPENRFLFNGKEQQVTGNLGLLDYGARMYDPEIARWSTIDPLAEKHPGSSPYMYVGNNPIAFIDPNGEDGVRVIDNANKTVTVKATYYLQTDKKAYDYHGTQR